MAKILVLYHSNSGNTAEMARLVAAGAQAGGAQVRVKSVDQAQDEDILWCDGLAVGCPTNLGALSWRMKKFWDDHSTTLWGKIDGKIACAFSSSGSYGGGAELACFSLLSVLLNYGFLVFGVTDYVGRRFSPHYGATVAGTPEKTEEKNACLLLGQRLTQWVTYCIDREISMPATTHQ